MGKYRILCLLSIGEQIAHLQTSHQRFHTFGVNRWEELLSFRLSLPNSVR